MIDRCEMHGEELEGEWEDNPPATRIVVSDDKSFRLCESCYKMIRQHDLHLVCLPMEVPLWS